MSALDTARAVLAGIEAPDGRADLTNPQKIALAQAIATVELAEQQQLANTLRILAGSHLLVEEDVKKETAPLAVRRQKWRNSLRAMVRRITGIDVPPISDGE